MMAEPLKDRIEVQVQTKLELESSGIVDSGTLNYFNLVLHRTLRAGGSRRPN